MADILYKGLAGKEWEGTAKGSFVLEKMKPEVLVLPLAGNLKYQEKLALSPFTGGEVLSHKWILEAKQEYKVEFRIRNNGKKLYFDKLDTESRNQDKKEDDLSSVENMLTEAARISREEQGLDVDYMAWDILCCEI